MKPIHTLSSPGRLLSALGLAGSLLMAGCGGSESTSPTTSPTEQPASVQITETASGLSVKSSLTGQGAATSAASSARSASAASGGNETETESGNGGTSVTQTAQFTLTATAGGANLLQGTLALRAESEDSGATELEGRFVPTTAAAGVAPATPSADALGAFQAAKDALKATLRTSVEQLRAAYDAAVAADPTSKSAARATFKAAVATAMDTFRADLANAAATAGITLGGRGEGGRNGSNGTEVKGTLDGNALTLTIRQHGSHDKIVLTGTGSLADGFTGATVTVNGAAATGEWKATPSAVTVPTVPLPPVTVPPVPPVTPAKDCASQTVTWAVGSASCSANFAGGASGTSATLTNVLATTTGSVTASCKDGTVATAAPKCASTTPAPVPVPVPTPTPTPTPTPPPPAPTGDVAAGLAIYNGTCTGCHGTGKASAPAASTVAGLTSILNGVSSHSGFKAALLGQPQSLLDLSAYIASKK